jgi:hypothetical protein
LKTNNRDTRCLQNVSNGVLQRQTYERERNTAKEQRYETIEKVKGKNLNQKVIEFMAKRNCNCIWHCGRETKNISRICDFCWSNREAIYQARKAREAAAEAKPMSEKQRAALDKARMAKLLKQLPTSELLH